MYFFIVGPPSTHHVFIVGPPSTHHISIRRHLPYKPAVHMAFAILCCVCSSSPGKCFVLGNCCPHRPVTYVQHNPNIYVASFGFFMGHCHISDGGIAKKHILDNTVIMGIAEGNYRKPEWTLQNALRGNWSFALQKTHMLNQI